MSVIGLRVLAALVLVAALFGAGFQSGRHWESGVWLKRQAQLDAEKRIEFDGHLAAANAAASAAIADSLAARSFATSLTSEVNHVPISLARCPAVALPAAVLRVARDQRGGDAAALPRIVRGIAAGTTAPEPVSTADAPLRGAVAALQGVDAATGQDPQPATAAQPQGVAEGDAAGGGVAVSWSAVRLWNAGLAGVQLPAGACRADDPTSAACAADAPFDLTDVWDNHIENATSCREDRSRYRRLIEYLATTQPASPSTQRNAP